MALGSGIKQGFEHRQAIDMVPMAVGNQQMGIDGFRTLQALTQRENPRTSVEN
jgi:hypothetical protein